METARQLVSKTEQVTEDGFIRALGGPELDQMPSSRQERVDEDPEAKCPFLLRFRVVLFGISLGISGQAGLWKSLSHSGATKRFGIPTFLHETLWIVGIVVLTSSTVLYIAKAVCWPGGVRREFIHPVRANFFAAPFVAALLLLLATPRRWIVGNATTTTNQTLNDSESFLEIDEKIQPSLNHIYMKALFFVVMTPLLVLELYLYGAWMYSQKRTLRSGNPAYQLALVGNFVGANLAAQVGLDEIGLFLFAVGTLYYLLVFISIYQVISREVGGDSFAGRDAVHRPHNKFRSIEPFLHPILFLFIAPPSAAALARTQLTSDKQMDHLAKSFFFISLFLFLSLLHCLILFLKHTPFTVSYWAYTFPMAALGSSAIEYATTTKSDVALYFSLILAGLATAVILIVAILTVYKGLVTDLLPNDPVIHVATQQSKSRENETNMNRESAV